jgi:glycosyltransferase involved in cell wall biosynthesis
LKRAILIAVSDLVFDQRVNRTATALAEVGFKVLMVGRKLPSTPKLSPNGFRTFHLRVPFRKSAAFYACFNLQVFFFLLFSRFNIAQANDLDTLLGVRLACFIRRKPLVYDSHELYTELPELVSRPRTRTIWQWLERKLVKGLKHTTTVSEGVANELKKMYGITFTVVRNLPLKKKLNAEIAKQPNTIIYQGALNLGRGLEKLIAAMQFLSNFKLIIAGTGDVEGELKQLSESLNLSERITFLGRITPNKLHPITCAASIGVSIEEDYGLNYRYALPNKLFDYIQAGLPVLVSNLPEMARIVTDYNIGLTISSSSTATELAENISQMLIDESKLAQWQSNVAKAANELVWENEKGKLVTIFQNAIKRK